jgi:hypothetical protein
MTCLIELHCLPGIAYFSSLSQYETIVLEQHERFEKQTCRNRYYINTTNGPERLVIPLTARHGRPLIRDVRIDYSQKWINNHRRAIESAYRKAPFFEFYSEELFAALFNRSEFLYDLNYELMTICLRWLKSGQILRESMAYERVPENGIHDLRNVMDVKKPERISQYFRPEPYQQVFGKAFAGNLSLVDLIFCEGPRASVFVKASAVAVNI